nr:zinc finger, CCHC-type [Tanacetum cinerariifolium]
MVEKDALLFDNFKGCVCSDYPDAIVGGRCSESNQMQSKNVESAKELWGSLESKYMVVDASSKKFLKNNKGKGKEVVGLSVNMIKGGGMNKNNKQKKVKKHGFKDNNGGSGSNKKAKLECWKCGKTGHFKRDCHSGNKKNNASAGGSGKGSKDQSLDQGQNLVDVIAWWIDSGATTHVCKYRWWFKTYEPVKDGSVLYMGDDHFAPVHEKGSAVLEFSSGKSINLLMAVVKLPGPKRKTLGEKVIDCIFVGYVEYSKAYRPKDIIPNSDESQRNDHSNDVPSETPEPCKSKRARKAKSHGYDFQLYLVEGSRDQIRSQYSYCYSIEEDPRTYNESMQSRDGCKPLCCKWIFKRKMKFNGTIDKFKARLVIQGFRQKEEIDYFDTYAPVACITTIRLLLALSVIHNLVIHQMDVKTVFLNGDLEEKVYIKQPEVFLCHVMSIRKPMDQLKYSRAIGCLMYVMTSTRPNIAYAVGRLSMFTSNPSRQHWHVITRVFKYLKGTTNYGLSYVGYHSVLEGYSDTSWINHVEDSFSTSGWVFLLGGGAISWASKKQIRITGFTMEYEFVALAATGKEAEWLRDLIHEIPIWSKPIAPISIRCDSFAILAKAYSQLYNGK